MLRIPGVVLSLITFAAVLPAVVFGQVESSAGQPDEAKTQTLSTVTVTGDRVDDAANGVTRLDGKALAIPRINTSDTARLLEGIPGVSSYGAGGISSLPVVHGLADDRLRTQVDGMDLMTACPNHMNPALSFVDPNKVAAVEVFAGIAPVSVGGDSIGGTIQVNSAPPRFARNGEGVLAEGQLGIFSRSNGNARGNNGSFMLANEFLNLSYSESNSESDNYHARRGEFKEPGIWQTLSGGRIVEAREVGASEYRGSKNRELGLALRLFDKHVFELTVGEQRLDYEGFPNQRMDMISSAPTPEDAFSFVLDRNKPANVNRLKNFHYTGQFGWGDLEMRVFHQRLKHHMDMLPERYMNMMMPMDTVATTEGGVLKGSIDITASDILRIGYDYQKYRLDDWWPPIGMGVSMCCEDFWNIRDGKRDRKAVFAEWEAQWSPAWMTLLGVRRGTVTSDAGQVQGYSHIYSRDADPFNALDHRRRDRHFDWTALARFSPDAMQTYEAGVARKNRSPNLYERYPWSYNSMAALMNNFVGDGNGYIGNPDLKPERARTLSASADWHDENQEKWQIKLTGYRTRVKDFIDAERCTPEMNSQCPLSNATTTDSYVKLIYVNQSALLKGFDLSGRVELGRIEDFGAFTLTGMLSYTRGKNRTTRDNLYHIMPLNGKLGLVQRLGSWTNTLEIQKVEDKKKVSQVRNEATTFDYTLVNLYSSYEWKHARLDVGVENVTNKFYLLPLGGAYVGQGNPMTISGVPWGMVVPGRGRSVNVALNFRF